MNPKELTDAECRVALMALSARFHAKLDRYVRALSSGEYSEYTLRIMYADVNNLRIIVNKFLIMLKP